jgi:hypothetical protein
VNVSTVTFARSRVKRLTVQGDEFDVYAVPDSPRPTKRAKNTSRQLGNPSQNTTGDTIHVSTTDRHSETIHRKEPSLCSTHPRSRKKPTIITRIQRALETNPSEGLAADDIFDWFRINESKLHEERGPVKLRNLIRTTLDRELEKEKPTVWRNTDGIWRLKPAVAESNAEESMKTRAKRQTYTPSLLVQSSMGGQTSVGTPELCEDTSRSELQETHEGDHEHGRDVHPAASLQIESEYEPTSIDSRPQAPAQETLAYDGNKTPQPRAATRSAQTVGEQTSNPDDTPTQQSELPAESTPTIHNDKPPVIEEARVPVDSCDGPKQDGKDEPDFGGIVRELRRIKEEREAKELEIKKGYNAMPDLSVLTQSAEGAQHAADEARRAADEAQRAANEAQCVAEAECRALEEASAKKLQIAADELYLEGLIRNSNLLRSELGID